jgi:hypothetical protein
MSGYVYKHIHTSECDFVSERMVVTFVSAVRGFILATE